MTTLIKPLEGGKLWIDTAQMRAKGWSLMAAIPAYGPRSNASEVACHQLKEHVRQVGIPFALKFQRGNSNVGLARDLITAEFLATGMTHLLFIDSDVVFPYNEPVRMMAEDLDILGAVYPKKHRDEGKIADAAREGRIDKLSTAGALYPFKPLDGPPEVRDRCVEVDKLPGGFNLIRRDVFIRIIQQRPDIKFDSGDPGNNPKIESYLYDFFPMRRDGRAYCGEDFAFFALARSCGIKVFADTHFSIGHIGEWTFWSDPEEVRKEALAHAG